MKFFKIYNEKKDNLQKTHSRFSEYSKFSLKGRITDREAIRKKNK
jgi:hypothetical protein